VIAAEIPIDAVPRLILTGPLDPHLPFRSVRLSAKLELASSLAMAPDIDNSMSREVVFDVDDATASIKRRIVQFSRRFIDNNSPADPKRPVAGVGFAAAEHETAAHIHGGYRYPI
jgi:hypothetical protein